MANRITLNNGFCVDIQYGTVTVPATFETENPFADGTTTVRNSIELPLVLPFTAKDVLAGVRALYPKANAVAFEEIAKPEVADEAAEESAT